VTILVERERMDERREYIKQTRKEKKGKSKEEQKMRKRMDKGGK